MRKILIIGCGRSGTKYIAQVCRRGGIRMGHERPWSGGTASWYATVTNWSDIHQRKIEGYDEALFLHQVRDPLKVISSFQRSDTDTWEYVCRYAPEISGKERRVKRCMKYWKYWNLLAEERAEWTYKVEDLFEDSVFEKFCRYTTIDPGRKKEMQTVPTTVHKKKLIYPVLTWKDLLAEDRELASEIIEQGKRYGYKV